MLGQSNVHAIIAVKDMARARQFYEQTLGLQDPQEIPGGVMYRSGNSNLFVYVSDFAGTNKANAASWEVDDIDAVVADLKSKGVTFEQYDMPGVTREGDVHVMGPVKSAWFKDPDDNTLCISNNI